MMVRWLLPIYVLGLMMCAERLAAGEMDPAVAEAVRQAVVAIEAGDQFGFGTIVAADAKRLFVLTAAHVIAGNPFRVPVAVRLAERPHDRLEARPLGADDRLDVAIVAVPRPASFTWTRPPIGGPAISRGAPVWFVGRDSRWFVPAAPGRVQEVDRSHHRLWLLNLPVLPGSSGAPVFDATGIVGVVVTDGIGDLTEAIRIHGLGDWLARIGVPFDPTVERQRQRSGSPSRFDAPGLVPSAPLGPRPDIEVRPAITPLPDWRSPATLEPSIPLQDGNPDR